MRIVTNTELIRRNRRMANILFFFSMGVLIAGFLVANLQLTAVDGLSLALSVILPWIVLPIGLISTLASVRMTNLWVRRPRPEDAIPAGLKGMSKRSTLYNYYHFPARHVLIAPQGVFAIITRYQDGAYSVTGDKWQSQGGPFAALGRFFRRDGIGSPNEEAQKAADFVKGLLVDKLPDIQVQPLIIFVDPRARVEINEPTIPVLFAHEDKEPNLRDYMRQISQQQQSTGETQPVSQKKKFDKSKPDSQPESTSYTPEQIADALEEATVLE